MKSFKQKISFFTALSVISVVFLGIICPMKHVSSAVQNHESCFHEELILTGENNSAMTDCMNGKLTFLGNFLVSMPENLISLVVVAIVLAILYSVFPQIYWNIKSLLSRWKILYLNYLSGAKILKNRSFLGWLISVEHPVLIA